MKDATPNGEETKALLRKLTKSAAWWQRFVATTDATQVHELVSQLSPLDFATLDQRVRGVDTYGYYVNQKWDKLRAADVANLAKSKFAVSLVGLTSFHRSGYVREESVQQLAIQRSGSELPFLLIRLNDWVPQVREAASAAVKARLEPAYAAHFLANMPLVQRLQSQGRVDPSFITEVHALLRCSECSDVLSNGMASNDKNIRRVSFQLALEAEPSNRTAIIRRVIDDPDSVVRAWAANHFLADVSADELPSLIEPMLGDRFVPVRRVALWTIATKRPDLARVPLRGALLDKHVSVRDTARQFLVLADVADLKQFYIEAIMCGGQSQRFAAICGLGESGKSSDVTLLAQFFSSPIVSLRRAAVYSVGRLDVEGNFVKLTEFLADSTPSVSREALKVLLPKAKLLSLDALEKLLLGNLSFHVRRNALILIRHAQKWQKLPALLSACADEDSKILAFAAEAIREWIANYNRSFAEPTRADHERIQSVLKKVESKLPRRAVLELKSCLKIYFK